MKVNDTMNIVIRLIIEVIFLLIIRLQRLQYRKNIQIN